MSEGPGTAFLHALAEFMHHERNQPLSREQYQLLSELQTALDNVDWYAVQFALNAIASGQDLYSNYPGNDILHKYTPHSKN